MITFRDRKLLVGLFLGLLALASSGCAAKVSLDTLRAQGRASYEGAITDPGGLKTAVERFREVVKRDPRHARDWINLALALMQTRRHDTEALQALAQAAARRSNDARIAYLRGAIYWLDGDLEKAEPLLAEAARGAPDCSSCLLLLARTFYSLGRIAQARPIVDRILRLGPHASPLHYAAALMIAADFLSRHGQMARGQAARRKAERIIAGLGAAAQQQTSLVMGRMTQILDIARNPRAPLSDATVCFEVQPSGLPATSRSGETVAYLDRTDLLIGGRWWRFHGNRFVDVTPPPWRQDGATVTLAGAFDNSGQPVVLRFGNRDAVAWRRVGTPAQGSTGSWQIEGRFAYAAPVRAAVATDYDADGDLDVYTGRLYRNDGGLHFTDVTRASGLPPMDARAVASLDFNNDNVVDLVAIDRAGTPHLFKGSREERFQEVPLPAISGARSVVCGDVNNDGWTDMLFITKKGLVLCMNRGGKRFDAIHLKPVAERAVLCDVDNNGWPDIVWQRADAMGVLQNEPDGFHEAFHPLSGAFSGVLCCGDFRGTLREDVLCGDRLLRNRTKGEGSVLVVALHGHHNNQAGVDARVEVRAGNFYASRMVVDRPLRFGLGSRQKVDTVRVVWPNGVLQNVQNVPTAAVGTPEKRARLDVEEPKVMLGSCPFVYTRKADGRVDFVSDILGGSPMGIPIKPGVYMPVRDSEVLKLPRTTSVQRGTFPVRVTEELREVTYVDEAALQAVDHPKGLEAFPNEYMAPPPWPRQGVHLVRRRIHPIAAHDDHGHNILPLLLRTDHRYPTDFPLLPPMFEGIAKPHSIVLTFPDLSKLHGRLCLFLTGWLAWPDASTNFAAAQDPRVACDYPTLSVPNGHGGWTVIDKAMGVPAGMTTTAVVDLTGRFHGPDWRLKITTSMCVYWDEIFIGAEDNRTQDVRVTTLHPLKAILHWRGFSRPRLDPHGLEPLGFDYAHVSQHEPWLPICGLFTRYGDVTPLVRATDDQYVIMDAGDELALDFDPHALPALPKGWVRDWFLFLRGGCKDGDRHVYHSKAFDPLPFHAMRAYPYAPAQTFPDTRQHRAYMARWNTRRIGPAQAARIPLPFARPAPVLAW